MFLKKTISENQLSGFRPGDSYATQLIAITHEIYSSFDKNSEVTAVFQDIFTPFAKVWHEGIIHELKRIGISG